MGRIDDLCIKTIMMLSADGVQKANSGHPGMPMGDATMAYVLWRQFLKHSPKNSAWHNRDRFVLSAGHGSMLLYSLLHLTGHHVSMEEIKNFRQLHSKTPGHPEYCLPCGIETTTGPLGQGFATSVGIAMAERYLAETFNKPGFKVVDYYTYGICGDGDMMEGVTAEAASLAGHLGLGKLIYLYSDNKITIEGKTDIAFTEDVEARFKAYGWHTVKVDGYDQAAIAKAIASAQKVSDKPSLIIAHTHIGYMSPAKQDNPDAHGSPLGEDEIKLVKKLLGMPARKFYIPREVAKHMGAAVKKGAALEAKWNALMKKYAKKHPALASAWKTMSDRTLPAGWDTGLPKFKAKDGGVPTRSASGKFLNAVAAKLPQLIGGSADLAPSNNTFLKGFGAFDKGKSGKNIHFGVREHAMGAILNGMALSNMLIPYGGTFLVFTDYMRPATRISALMRAHVIYVMTHDSIGLGEDGPTHQPVEHLSSYRAMPGMNVMRPADANETVEAWKVALTDTSGPHMIVLSRQKLPVLDRGKCASASNFKRGGHVLYETAKKVDLILISSGAEVSLCLDAADTLAKKGVGVRVVNMPSTSMFDKQSASYREKVLPKGIKARVAVEAASTLSWYKYVGTEGVVIGMESFGESAPAGQLFKHFGFTADNIVKTAGKLLK